MIMPERMSVPHFIAWAVFSLAAFSVSPTDAAGAETASRQIAGEVVSVSGKVFIRADGQSTAGVLKPAKGGDSLYAGDVVNTSSDGQVKLLLKDKTIVDLGTTLNMAVMAEGVETREQLQILEAMGCKQFQGYLFGKPMPLAALREQAAHTMVLRPSTGESGAPRPQAPAHA